MKAIKSRKARIFAVAMLGILAASFVAYAAIRYQTTIQNQVNVTTYGVQLDVYSTGAQVTSISWGSLTPPQTISTDSIYGGGTGSLVVKNVGDFPCWITWNASAMPTGFTLLAGSTQDGSNTYSWTQNTGVLGKAGNAIPVGGLSDRVFFYVSVDSSVAHGTYSFTIVLQAVDSASG
jgi:hypothetical protein